MKLTESRLRTLIEEELEKARAMIKIGPNQYYRDETIEFIRRLKEKHPGIDKRMIEKLATLNRLPGRAGIPRQQSETIAAAMEKYLVIDSGIPDGETIKRGIPSPRGGFTLDNMIRALDAAAKSTYKGPKGPGFPTMPGGTINEQAEPNNAFDALRVLEPYEFLNITPDSFKVFLHRGVLGPHYHAYVIVDGRKVIAPGVITTDGDPIGAQGDSESEAMGTLWNSIKAARPKASKLTRAAAKPQAPAARRGADTTPGRAQRRGAAKSQPQAAPRAAVPQAPVDKNLSIVLDKNKSPGLRSKTLLSMFRKIEAEKDPKKRLALNNKLVKSLTDRGITKDKISYMLKIAAKGEQKAAVRDKTIAGQVPKPAPADVANAFDPEVPGATGSGAKPVQGNIYAGKSTREILNILKRTEKKGIFDVPISHPARVAFRKAYNKSKRK